MSISTASLTPARSAAGVVDCHMLHLAAADRAVRAGRRDQHERAGFAGRRSERLLDLDDDQFVFALKERFEAIDGKIHVKGSSRLSRAQALDGHQDAFGRGRGVEPRALAVTGDAGNRHRQGFQNRDRQHERRLSDSF